MYNTQVVGRKKNILFYQDTTGKKNVCYSWFKQIVLISLHASNHIVILAPFTTFYNF